MEIDYESNALAFLETLVDEDFLYADAPLIFQTLIGEDYERGDILKSAPVVIRRFPVLFPDAMRSLEFVYIKKGERLLVIGIRYLDENPLFRNRS
jgi:hypothetical protein